MKRFLCLLIIVGVVGCFAPPHPVTPPVPPTPDVVVPATGIRVLIVFESSANYSREVLNILNSTAVMAKLNEICVKADGWPEWRKWDQSSIEATGLENESEIWQQLWADTKPKLTTLPVVVAVTDQRAMVYPLPATEAEMLDLLQKVKEGK